MARKKLARNQDLERTIKASIRDVVNVLFSEDGPKVLSRGITYFEQQAMLWTSMRDWLATTPRKKVERWVNERLEFATLTSRNTGILEEDLIGIKEALSGVACVLSTGLPPTGNQKAARILFKHLLDQRDFQPRRFKPQFEEAFRIRHKAEQSDKLVTILDLTQRLTPYEFRKNPEAALRSMERGIRRVRVEHERCVALGLPSPFLLNIEKKKRHK